MDKFESIYRTADPAAAAMLAAAEAAGIPTAWGRFKAQQPQCRFGLTGACCKICMQGPCRIVPGKPGMDKGVCGADLYTIVARNVVRHMAGGASAHSDHGREIAYTLLHMAEGRAPDYKVGDPEKLLLVAAKVGVATEGRAANDVAKDVAVKALQDFGKYDDEPCAWLSAGIDDERRKKFADTNVIPTAIDRSVSQLMHQTHMGVDNDPVNLIFGGIQASLADFTGMSLATDITDILFGTPSPVVTEANLGVLDPAKVNIAVHGHNPLLSQMVVYAARELEGEAHAAGAAGVNLVGICCTGNEVLMREGVPPATNFASQELVVMTGVLDGMVVDVQCVSPAVRDVCACFHTALVTTSRVAKMPGVAHVEFDERNAMEGAKRIVRMAIGQYKKRDPSQARLPAFKKQVVAGFSLEALLRLLASLSPAPDNPVRALTDAIRSGEIKGVCAFAGCNNQKTEQDLPALEIAKSLAKNDVFLVATGCAAGAFAKAGLLSGEGVDLYAGDGLKRFIRRLESAAGGGVEAKDAQGAKGGANGSKGAKLGAAGGRLVAPLPLVFHMGSCVDNSRVQNLWTLMAKDMGVSVPQLPFVASAPEAMSEKAVSIGTWVVSMGVPCHVGVMPPLDGSDLIYGLTTQIARDVFGGYFIFETDPAKAADKLLARIEKRAWKLRVLEDARQKYGGVRLAASYEA